MNTLPLFDIQRGSLVDGPGVRTTVFFRGCPLRCAWCHNPESQSGGKHLLHYAEKCVQCGICDRVCPVGAVDRGQVRADLCTFCGKCAARCPQNALRLCGFDMTEDALTEILVRDLPFYRESGGGVTFSGGECMLYPEAIARLAARCRAEGISVAVDTAGAVPWKNFEQVLSVVDLFLYDIKTLDPEIHRRYTGQDNTLPLDNLRRLLSAGCRVTVRVPVIPGVNATVHDMEAIRDFLSPYPEVKAELLPYHRMGENKYPALGMAQRTFDVPDEETMKKLKNIFRP